MKTLISIALGGGFGALARHYLSRFISMSFGKFFPLGTLAVNLAGALLIGFFYGMFYNRILPEEIRAFISIGFLGAFTTFSTFTLENIQLFQDGEIKSALINIAVSNIFGLLCVLAGMYIAGMLFQK
jgi:CrcB protein